MASIHYIKQLHININMATSIEQNVIESYNVIFDGFDKTRVMIWKCVKDFVNDIGENKNAKILDMGCGNGKNMQYFLDNGFTNIMGCDASEQFVSLCQQKSLDVIHGNLLNIPFPDCSFDYVICIAVLHHLSTDQHRIDGINKLLRITKPSGKILITVASHEFPFYKNLGGEQDCMVPWKNCKDQSIISNRYYHLFKKDELESMCNNGNIEHIESIFELFNWVVTITKKS